MGIAINLSCAVCYLFVYGMFVSTFISCPDSSPSLLRVRPTFCPSVWWFWRSGLQIPWWLSHSHIWLLTPTFKSTSHYITLACCVNIGAWCVIQWLLFYFFFLLIYIWRIFYIVSRGPAQMWNYIYTWRQLRLISDHIKCIFIIWHFSWMLSYACVLNIKNLNVHLCYNVDEAYHYYLVT